MQFDLHFSRPVNMNIVGEFWHLVREKYSYLDPFYRVRLVQDIFLDKGVRMKATLRIPKDEEVRDAGLQGLWGRN